MSSNKDNIDCPCSGTRLTMGQGSPGRHREPSVGLLDEAERRRQNTARWGAKVIDQLAVDRSLAFPGTKGFSRRNLH